MTPKGTLDKTQVAVCDNQHWEWIESQNMSLIFAVYALYINLVLHVKTVTLFFTGEIIIWSCSTATPFIWKT